MPEKDFAGILVSLESWEDSAGKIQHLLDNPKFGDVFFQGIAKLTAENEVLRALTSRELGTGDNADLVLDDVTSGVVAQFAKLSRGELVRALATATEYQSGILRVLSVLCNDNASGAQRANARAGARTLLQMLERHQKQEEQEAAPETTPEG